MMWFFFVKKVTKLDFSLFFTLNLIYNSLYVLRNSKSFGATCAGIIALLFLAFQLGFSYTNIAHFIAHQPDKAEILEFNKTESSSINFDFDAHSFIFINPESPTFLVQLESCITQEYSYFTLFLNTFKDPLYQLFHQWKIHLIA